MTVGNRDLFKCKCGCGENLIDPRIPMIHAKLEEAAGHPIKVNSAYRCKKHNADVEGSSDTSSHPKGLAVDEECRDSRTRFRIIRKLIEIGITRIGIRKDFIHWDIDRQKDSEVMWPY